MALWQGARGSRSARIEGLPSKGHERDGLPSGAHGSEGQHPRGYSEVVRMIVRVSIPVVYSEMVRMIVRVSIPVVYSEMVRMAARVSIPMVYCEVVCLAVRVSAARDYGECERINWLLGYQVPVDAVVMQQYCEIWIYRNAYYHTSGNYVVSIYSDCWPVLRGGHPCPNFFIYGLRSVLGLRVGLIRRI